MRVSATTFCNKIALSCNIVHNSKYFYQSLSVRSIFFVAAMLDAMRQRVRNKYAKRIVLLSCGCEMGSIHSSHTCTLHLKIRSRKKKSLTQAKLTIYFHEWQRLNSLSPSIICVYMCVCGRRAFGGAW